MTTNPHTNSPLQSTINIDNRHNSRAKGKWPVVIQIATGPIIGGKTENLSLSGAFIRLPRQSDSDHNLAAVLDVKERFIPCTARLVWSDERSSSDQSKPPGLGVHFTRMMLHNLEFVYGEISGHFQAGKQLQQNGFDWREKGLLGK